MNLAAWQIATAVVVLGILLLVGEAYLEGEQGASPLEEVLKEIGALLVVAGALSIAWDLRGRRALTNEVLAAANLSTEVSASGLKRMPPKYHDFEWDDLFETASHVDLFFAYARTWRGTHASALRKFVARGGTRLRVVLPDLDDQPLVSQLAAKFGYTDGELRGLIKNAEDDFANLRTQASGDSTVEVRRTKEFPVFTYYRFDRTCIGVLYAQARGRTEVPSFECEQGGSLAAFFRDQFDALWLDSVPATRQDGEA